MRLLVKHLYTYIGMSENNSVTAHCVVLMMLLLVALMMLVWLLSMVM